MFSDSYSSVFSMENFFDEVTVIDTDGIIQYCKLYIPNAYSFKADEIIGKHILSVFPSISKETSQYYHILKTKKPIIFYNESFTTYTGDVISGYSSAYPLFKNKEFIGVAFALKFIDSGFDKEFIQLFKNGQSQRNFFSNYYSIDDIITADPYMLNLKNKIEKIAKKDSYVLLQGNTGTGKEVVAQALHYSSYRADKPFISQNCSSIPLNLLESTLFGTEKGSFTGATTTKGLLEFADGGTLFLDEISSMDFSLQSKLLKAIEEKNFRRVGGHELIHVDIRIISALNCNPFEAIRSNLLRKDLFYRLNVNYLKLSDLKDREGDILLLANYYINYFNETMGMKILGLDSNAENAFLSHDWPGNIRELKNIIEGAFNLVEGDYISLEDLPDYLKDSYSISNGHILSLSGKCLKDQDYNLQIEAFEKQIIKNAINSNKNKSEAAKSLGLSRQAFNYKLDKLGLKE